MGMTWRLTRYATTRRSLPGVPWRDLTDEEYESALAANPGMDQRGYFEPVEDEGTQAPSPSPRRPTKADEPVTAEESTDG